MTNPFRRIRELERQVEIAELARVKAEDENRVLYAQRDCARESEAQARKDCMDLIARMYQCPSQERPAAPPPVRRPTLHGAALEKAAYLQYAMDAEKELGIDAPN